jgi:hypothetical protein
MQLYSIENRKLKLNLHPGQTLAWDSVARFVFVIAGTQSGKTSFGPWWMWREINQGGGGDYLAVTSTYDLFKLKMLPEMLTVFEAVLRIGRYWAGDGVIEIADPSTGKFWANRSQDKMWARIILRSAESKGGLESSSARAAWLDECGQDSFTLDTWQAVLRRLSLSRGRVLGTTTPYNSGWLKQTIVDKSGNNPQIAVVNFPSYYNPAFSKEEYDERKAEMESSRFAMFYDGLFARPVGMVYHDFIDAHRDQGGHLITRAEFEALAGNQPVYVGVDPGAVNTAMIWLYHDVASDIYYLFRETLEGNKSTAEHVQGAVAFAQEHSYRVIRWMVGQKAEVQQRLDWKRAGVRNVFEPDVHDVASGIDRVISLLKTYRLYVVDDCHGVRDEFVRYVREVDSAGNVLETIRNKEKFHLLDGLRYGVVGVTSTKGVLVG